MTSSAWDKEIYALVRISDGKSYKEELWTVDKFTKEFNEDIFSVFFYQKRNKRIDMRVY